MRATNTLRPNTILLILALCAGLLPSPADAQGKTPLDICLDDKRTRASRVDACRTAAKQGYATAQGALGSMYYNGQGVPKDYAQALRWYRLAAEQGDAYAQYNLGDMYGNGQGVPKDYAQAMRWYRLAAEQGDAAAQYNLGVMYAKGQGVPKDYAQAMRWFRLAAEQGDAYAQFNLGTMYAKGHGVPQDYAEAGRWYRLAAEQGDAAAQYNLGVMYAKGQGAPKDYAQAMRWYRLAAEQGYAAAQYNLGVMYAKGQGVPKDYAQALRWYRLAANQGDAKAQYNLGSMYYNGQGVPKDYAQALRWYRLAAEQGDAYAQFNLGTMYAKGHGVPQDYAEAGRWYRLAAEQGDAAAQYNLGVMYAKGQGVPKDYAQAMRWYRLAANQGDAKAQYNLGYMYAQGYGVPQDYVRAHMWWNLAAGGGFEISRNDRDSLKKEMTPYQLAEAQRMAREWLEKRGKGRPARAKTSSGTAFFLNPRGYLLTNQHVVDDCKSITLKLFNQPDYEARVVAADEHNDLAILNTKYPSQSHAVLRGNADVRSGDSVTAVGYPLSFVLSAEPRVTTGTVSATSGIQGDTRVFQIEAAVQPGNSGGPLFDDHGHVVGIVSSGLNQLTVAAAIGSIPQNVNFAIKSTIAQVFLDANKIDYFTAEAGPRLDPAQIMDRARGFTAYVQCRH